LRGLRRSVASLSVIDPIIDGGDVARSIPRRHVRISAQGLALSRERLAFAPEVATGN
jgi:hypothetical protein